MPLVREALNFFEVQAESITREQEAICSIPAPPFGEQARGEYLKERIQQLLSEVQIDQEGNCVALRPGHSRQPLLAISAHLDTVFPSATDFTVRRLDQKLLAPGIADNGCGLAALLALIRALEAARIETLGSVLFVGSVGEEGAGNLRGANYLLSQSEWAGAIDCFLSLDGSGAERITNAALGSRRYRVTFTGPGGHSWGDFGAPNPVHAMGRAIARLAIYPAPVEPRTTFNVGRVEGGAGVNVIASEARMDVDLRSESKAELDRLERFLRRSVREAAAEENGSRRAGSSALTFEITLIGERPSGRTPKESPLVRLAEEATRTLGLNPRLDCSSTDSNMAMAKGIPAITIGAGGTSGCAHTLKEWFDPRERHLGLKRALLILLGVVGIAEPA